MKLLHTSDLRLGQSFAQVHSLAAALREARLEAVGSLLALAAREKVDAIVLAGNTLADRRVSHQLVVQLTSRLATSSVPVYLWPGETDPYAADSPYALRSDLFQGPIQVLTQPVLPWQGPPVAVGCGPTNPGLKADYVAMGGRPLAFDQAPAYWSGTPEGYDYGHGQGSVNLVTFPGPQLRRIPLGRYTWLEKQASSLQGLSQELDRLASDSTLLRLHLSGRATFEELQQFEAWKSRPRFQWLEVDNQLRLEEGARYQHPLLRSLQSRVLDPAGDAGVTRQAVLDLHSLLSKSGKEDLA